MKKTNKIILPALLFILLLFGGCKDELQDTSFDHVMFELYDGRDIHFVNLWFENYQSDYAVHCAMINYGPEWPRGTFQLRYGLDHVFDADTMLYIDNPIEPNAEALTRLNFKVQRTEVFNPYHKLYVKPFYVTSDEVYEGEETEFTLLRN